MNDASATSVNPGPLKRRIGLWLLLLYGLGNILGAGIYVLVGKVAGEAGSATAWAFVLASAGVAFTVFSYAELAARYPVSAGVAVYLYQAFSHRWLSVLVGLLVMVSGITSAATISHGFVGYFQVFWDLPTVPLICGLIVVLGGIAIWGISESVKVVAVLTLVEAGGLLLIVIFGGHFAVTSEPLTNIVPSTPALSGVVVGAFLAFYAFIGFEDMVNIAEEVKRPERNLPLAAVLALLIATVLYALVSVVATSVVSPAELAASDAPLALIYERSTGTSPLPIVAISLFAVVNGALIQIIMGARILYGMARQGWLPSVFSRVWWRTATPVLATVIVVLLTLIFALAMPLERLAELTSLLVLLIFVMVNGALLRIKQRQPVAEGVRCYPRWVPIVGLVISMGFIAARWLLA